ncbi:MAG: carbonate dehydratase [Gammaproteobacteria bacterium]
MPASISSLRKNPTGIEPEVHPSAYIDETAVVIGRVIIGARVFVGPYSVIRADELDAEGQMQPVIIGADSNIQDGVVIHSAKGAAVTVGERVCVAHRSIVHGPCQVGSDCFIGFNAVIFRSHVGAGCIVQHNAVIDGLDIPTGLLVPPLTSVTPGFDLGSLRKAEQEHTDFAASVVAVNQWLTSGYKALAGE